MTEKELEEIKDQVRKVLAYSQGVDVSDVNVDKIIDRWYKAKKRFIDYWGSPIKVLNEKVSINITEGYKETEKNIFADFIMEHSPNLLEFEDFIRSQKGEDFFNNHISEDYDKGPWVCPKGSKISKAFKHFLPSGEDVDFYQIKYSQIIQQSKITGTLCVSVHPLDFLSMSENNYKWRTCTSLNGDYAVSALNYILDPSTIILYIKGTDDSPPGVFPIQWNNKKWRMLMYLSVPNDCHCKFLVTGRQYPFPVNEFVEKEIYSYLLDITGSFWQNFHNNYKNSTNYPGKKDNLAYYYIPINEDEERFFTLESFIDQQNNLMYNDVLQSNKYIPYYTFSGDQPVFPGEVQCKVGADVPCIVCGRSLFDSKFQAGDFICGNCWEILEGNCSMCGQMIPSNELGMYYDDDVHMVCQSCWTRLKHKKGVKKWQ